ncbi:lysozyme inhibitor LprI family protein [Rhizobium sp. SG2393]|uniref:lysozyme inhibitor LprI family protein n=1 Tax=Rhizobium sp. SG2393 TaxID=3276279 RepID=UPI00367086F8
MRAAVVAMGVFLSALPVCAEDAPAIDCNNAMTQADMNACAAEDFQKADKALNALWPRVRKAMADWDKTVAESALTTGAEAALLKAQRAWIDYRDGQCEAEGFSAHGGTMEPLLIESCKATMTRSRTQELEALLKMY